MYLGPEVLQVQLERKRVRDEKEKEASKRREDQVSKKRLREEKEKEASERRAKEKSKRKDAYDKVWAEVSHRDSSLWTKAQLKVLVSYKKNKTDEWRLPTTVSGLLEKWEIIKDRPEPGQELVENFQQQENEENCDEDDESESVNEVIEEV